jgi:phosphoglucosamine mutase
VRYSGESPLERAEVKEAIEAAKAELAGKGRVLVRKSGTEPLLRVMIEGEDEARITALAQAICDIAKTAEAQPKAA